MENMNSNQLKRKFNQIEDRIDVALSSSCVYERIVSIFMLPKLNFKHFLMDIFNEDFNNF